MSDRVVYGLQAGRGVAALAVVLFHAEGALNKMAGLDFNFFAFGHAGVHYFFVISGFIIARSHRLDIGAASAMRKFWLRRFFRIFPIFWIVMIVYGVKSMASAQWDTDFFLKSFFLIPMPQFPLLIPAWTLTHEMIFYAVFSFYLLLGKRATIIFAGWFGFVILSWIASDPGVCKNTGECIVNTFANPLNLLFGLGMVAENLARKAAQSTLRLLTYIGLVYLVAVIILEMLGIVEKGSGLDVFGYGFAFFLIVCGTPKFTFKPMMQRVSSFFGDISYAAYLIHGVVISLSIGVLFNILGSNMLLYTASMVVVVVLTIAASALMNNFIEKPVAKFAARMTSTVKRENA